MQEQIPNFLYTFQDLRQPCCAMIVKKEQTDIEFMTYPNGSAEKRGRDDGIRAKTEQGIYALNAAPGVEETVEWTEIKVIFAHDSEVLLVYRCFRIWTDPFSFVFSLDFFFTIFYDTVWQEVLTTFNIFFPMYIVET